LVIKLGEYLYKISNGAKCMQNILLAEDLNGLKLNEKFIQF